MKPIDSQKFLQYFDQDFRLVKEHEFRKALFYDGINENYRQIVWRFLFHFYSFKSTKRERFIKRNEKLVQYELLKERWSKIYQNILNLKVKEEEYDTIASPMVDFTCPIDLNNDYYDNSSRSVENLFEEKQDIDLGYLKIQSLLNVSRRRINNTKLMNDIKQIDKDLERTTYLIEIEEKDLADKTKIKNSLRNILITFSAFNQSSSDEMSNNGCFDLGYTQGMNEIASVFLSVFDQESIAYWCFSNYMLKDSYSKSMLTLNTTQITDNHSLKINAAHYFSDSGMSKKISHLKYLFGIIDPEYYQKLASIDLDHFNFCHEWLILNFKRCFYSTNEYQKCFEVLSSRYIEFYNATLKNINVKNLYNFDLFICISLMFQLRNQVLNEIENEMCFFEIFSQFNKSHYFEKNFKKVVQNAQEIFDKYCIISHSVNLNN
ncbi:TBC1 domain family member 15-like [Brachionus plicatilis]|uniref:TBC1 domain family member 15-like n=1 Tax=Brachionus plicatilis TaxID=10195 RepID=A0A3M7T298_BRAPC|nr:TBC1 domain family member 15-like [Brachionus plicatilis]